MNEKKFNPACLVNQVKIVFTSKPLMPWGGDMFVDWQIYGEDWVTGMDRRESGGEGEIKQ